MKHASLFFGLALLATTALSTASWAADSSSMQTTDQVATMPSGAREAVQTTAQQAYVTNTNPLASVGTTGPYDQEDAFKDSRGYPLPGWSVFGGDIQAAGGE